MLRNALDWLVSELKLISKPIALLDTSPLARFAQVSLIEIATVMTGRIMSKASITIPLLGRNLDARGIVTEPESAALQAAIATFVTAIQQV